MIDRRIAHYRLLERLGAGGMGEVYRAEDTRLHRLIALKILSPQRASQRENIERFWREARFVAALNHPNIVTIYSVEEHEGLHYLTMELVQGKTLGELIPPGGMPLHRVLEIAAPLTEALEAAHEQGIVHRDLKPNNVMVSDENRVKVLDFGIAKAVGSEITLLEGELRIDQSLTQAGQIVGTPSYVAPEQILGQPVDHRADLFTFGVLLYQMATGRQPFRGEDPGDTFSAILRDVPPSPSRFNPEIPETMDDLVARCLQKEVSKRIQSAGDLRACLQLLVTGSRRAFGGVTRDDLAALPVEDVPEPGPLPEGSHMPLSVNPLFVGREQDLRTIARYLRAGEASVVGQVEIAGVTGLGGIGKTQLASELVHRYGRFFEGGVFWMSFADPAAIPAEVAASGQGLHLHPSYNSLPLDQQTALVEAEWKKPVPRLLVFDNCEDEALFDRWRPRFGGARVLVTSRRSRWDLTLGVQAVPLATLPRAASLQLLRRFRRDIPVEEPALNGIAAELGDLPLALHLAGSFLERYSKASFGQPAAYLESLRQGRLLDHPSLQGKFSGISPTRHEVHVGRTFALSLEQLNPEDPTDELARALLARAACFAPGEPVPREFLLLTLELADPEEASLRAENALGRLMTLGLVEQGEGDALVMHRLVGECTRGWTEGDEARDAVERVACREALRLNQAGIPAMLHKWFPHLLAITDRAWVRDDPLVADLCNETGYYLLTIGDGPGARPYLERGLAIAMSDSTTLGPDHPQTADNMNNLGYLLQSQGDLPGALLHHERALAIREKVLGPEHPDTARGLNNLGYFFQRNGDFEGARPYYERALAIREKVLGPEHADTARSLNNLGVINERLGDFAGARTYYDRALAIRERVLPDHPDTARILTRLGALLRSQGDSAQARLCYERALSIFDALLGPDHPETQQLRAEMEGIKEDLDASHQTRVTFGKFGPFDPDR